jgi:hypothetical protein
MGFRFVSLALAVTAVATLAPRAAQAQTDTYLDTITGSGSVEGMSFTDATIVFTGIGNASSIVTNGAGAFENALTSASVTVNGSVYNVSDFLAVVTVSGSAYFEQFSGGSGVFGIINSASGFDFYGLNSSIDVVADSVGGGSVALDLAPGSQPFILTSYETGAWTGSWQQTTPGAAVPEPGSLMLTGTALLSLAALRRRQAR